METLILLAGPIGSGVAGSALFAALRSLLPPPGTRPGQPAYAIYWLIWSAQGARITAMVLSALVMVLATGALAAAQGEPVGAAMVGAIDAAIAASGISQLVHLPQLSGAVKTTEA